MSPEKTPELINTPENSQDKHEAIFQPGDTVIVKRSSGDFGFGWRVVANGLRVSQTTGENINVVTVQNPDGSAFKEVLESNLNRLQEDFAEKLAMDLGEDALDAVGIENPSQERGEQAPIETPEQIAIASLEQELDEIQKKLPNEGDKTAVWQCATAITENEYRRALNKMSPEVRVTGVHLEYEEKFKQLQQLRRSL